jgi:ribosome-associated protein
MHNDSDYDDEDFGPSKSAIKREHKSFQDLAKKLIELSEKELAQIPLTETLRDPIIAARKLKQSEALRRQIRYIGKIFSREDDSDQQAIQQAYQDLITGHQQQARNFHRLEALRDRLLVEGVDAIEDVINTYPDADRQHLRQLVLQANKEKKANKPPAAARKIFVYLRELAAANKFHDASETREDHEDPDENE